MSVAAVIATIVALGMTGVVIAGFVIAGREVRAKAKLGLHPCDLCESGWSDNEQLPCAPCRDRLRRR